jgi:hypothetical protein
MATGIVEIRRVNVETVCLPDCGNSISAMVSTYGLH